MNNSWEIWGAPPIFTLDLPTGSGFLYSLQVGLTWLFPSDPAVFFGSFSYLHNFKRDNVSRNVIGGSEFLGTVEPGDIIGFNFGRER
jgi:hypothetical protein